MKYVTKIILFFVLAPGLCFAQKIFKITDGDLQLISFKDGMVIKKNDGFYCMRPQKRGDNEIRYTKLDVPEFEKLKAYKTTVFKKDILPKFDIDSLKNIKFTYTDEDKTTNYSFLFNDFLFASFTAGAAGSPPELNNLQPFVYIEINGLKFIYIFEDGIYILPTTTGFKLLESEYATDKTVLTIFPHTITADEFSRCSDDIRSHDDDYYMVATFGKRQYQLKNMFGEVVIPVKYDSVSLNKVIVCRQKERFDLYDYQYTKLNKKPVKVFRIYYNCVQYIENNRVITKAYDGLVVNVKKYESFQFPYEPDGTQTYTFDIKKEGDNFYVYVDRNPAFKMKLKNINGIQAIYFHNNKSDDYIANLSRYSDCQVYFKLKNGKFGLNKLGKFIDTAYHDYGIYATYQDLRSVKGVNARLFKLEKNKLFMFYPLQKKFRYKTLNAFDGFFARFELPNGQQGWLAVDGKEYLDD